MPQALDWAAGRMKRKVIAAQDALAGAWRASSSGTGGVHLLYATGWPASERCSAQ
ncbi:MAG: hypothetical protein HND48_16590 [Chloroflexi bacterium]|nr:hypothetical protein [Chloroflexota bacterium]